MITHTYLLPDLMMIHEPSNNLLVHKWVPGMEEGPNETSKEAGRANKRETIMPVLMYVCTNFFIHKRKEK